MLVLVKIKQRNVNFFYSKYVKNKRYFLNPGVHIVQLPWRRLQWGLELRRTIYGPGGDSIHSCRRAGSWMGMWSKATLRILSLKQERERACWKGQSLSCSIDFCCFDLSMTTSQWEIYYPQSNLFYGKGKNPSTEWKRLTAKQGYLFHEFPNLRKLFVGWTTHFNLVLKMGRLQMK